MKDTQFPNVKCYDDGGKSTDRYTAVFTDRPEGNQRGIYEALAMNAEPFRPQGFGQHTTAMLGKHLGKRIDSIKLPEDCQRFIRQNC